MGLSFELLTICRSLVGRGKNVEMAREFVGGDIVRRGQAVSPGSGGASPYLRRGLTSGSSSDSLGSNRTMSFDEVSRTGELLKKR
jgi:hypothetical protein